MIPLACYDQHFVPLCHSYQLATTNSLAHQYTGKNLNQLNNQPVTRVESHSNHVAVPPLGYNQMAQSFSMSPSSQSQDKVSQGFYNRAMNSPLSHSKFQATSSPELHWRSPSMVTNKRALSLVLSHPKSQSTSSLDLNRISSSLETNQAAPRSLFPLPNPQITSSLEFFQTSPSLNSNQTVLSSSLFPFQHQEASSLDILCVSSSLGPHKRTLNSTLPQSKSQETSSLDCFWISLSEQNQKSLSSPTFYLNPQTSSLDFLWTSYSMEPSQITLSSPSPNPRPQTTPIVSTNPNILSLPLSHSKPWKSPLAHSVHQAQSLPLSQPKSQMVISFDCVCRTLSSPVCHLKFENTTSPGSKHRITESPSPHPKQNFLGESLPSSQHCVRNTAASTLGSSLQINRSCHLFAKTESNKEIGWTLDCIQPCIVKGGTVPDDVVNKIVNSISKTKIQRDLSRQILFRRMRGRPNPRPGPRISSNYMVCLACASCIKSQCPHLTGRKDPRRATLFVIPTPEPSPEGNIEVKLVLILSLPQNSFSSYFLLPMKEKQLNQDPEDNFEVMEQMSHFALNSELGLMKKKWLTVAPQTNVISQHPQAVNWLLHVKESNDSQSQSPFPSSSSTTSSSSSSSSS
ncbi:casein kinase II subunit alpha'-interacting protein, partial [Choloepus didactylus]|uniref:casein kinase II subunit alpha'-interacting protein n=1 Tax=Choloepus didactylus TaxID=27675 RepID=UPI00189E1A31